jgi:hypothetical protein
MAILSPLLTLIIAVQAGNGGIPVAMVLSSQGHCHLLGDEESRPLRVMQCLRAGDKVVASKESETIIVFLEDGHRERIVPNSTVTCQRDGCQPKQSVQKLPSKSVVRSHVQRTRYHVRGTRGAVGLLRGGGDKGAWGSQPIDTACILETKPRLAWRTVPQATNYSVSLFQADGIQKIWTVSTTETSIAFPTTEVPLTQGRGYRWKVSARLAQQTSQVVVNSSFLVATQREFDEIKQLQPLLESKELADLVYAALTLESYGVYDRVITALEKAVDVSSGDQHLVDLLRNYYRQAGRVTEAEALKSSQPRERATDSDNAKSIPGDLGRRSGATLRSPSGGAVFSLGKMKA